MWIEGKQVVSAARLVNEIHSRALGSPRVTLLQWLGKRKRRSEFVDSFKEMLEMTRMDQEHCAAKNPLSRMMTFGPDPLSICG